MRWLYATSLLLAAGCGEAPLQPRDPTPGVPHLVVMSYNVKLDEYDDAETVRAIGAANADIIALQESSTGWQEVLTDFYAEEYPYMLFHGENSSGALGVLSRYPLEDVGVLPGPKGWHPAWHVLVHSPLGDIQLLNVHLRSYFTGGSGAVDSYLTVDEDHRYEIELFSEACDANLSNIVLGDFNEGVDGRAVSFLEAEGFRNALPLYRPGQGTWRQRSLAAQLNVTLDHILFDENFEPLNAWVNVSGNSDHLPVLAHLEATQKE